MINEKRLSENIKKYRRMRGLSQTELGSLLFVSGQTVSKWENGLSFPDVSNLCALANALNVSADDLLCDRDENGGVYVGIDGGGTKTDFVLFDIAGNVLKKVRGGTGNPNIIGIDKCYELLAGGIDRLLDADADIRGIFAGIAGSGVGKNRQRISAFLQKRFPAVKVKVDSDIYNVISSVRGAENGIAVVWGTGVNVTAFTDDGFKRFGAWGYLFETNGGGYAIGNSVLRHTLGVEEGLCPQSVLAELTRAKLGGSPQSKLDEIYVGGKDFIASFASLAFEAAELGDGYAAEIVDENIKWLAYLMDKAAQLYDGQVSAVISGGLTYYEDVLISGLRKHLTTAPDIIIPRAPQIYGACLACLRMCDRGDCATEQFEANFLGSLPEQELINI